MVKKINPVLTTKEACQFLRISRPTFLKLIYSKQIPAKKVGKGWKVLRSELKAFLESGENRGEETRSLDQRTTILVADDERTLASTIRDVLVDQGHEVFMAEDGRQALDLLTSGRHFDLLITDIRMPLMGGLELLRHLRQQNKYLPAIAMTGYASAEERLQALKEGVFRYISKPFDIKVLIQAVEEALHHKSVP
jgi:excisionase family DNA binding protein